MTDIDILKYPIGRFERPASVTAEERRGLVRALAQMPADLRAIVEPLSDTELDTPYRSGGWTIRQVVHHVPDSHMNGYIRMRLAATEDAPAVMLYDQARWANLSESRTAPIGMSLDLLDALHRRWVAFLAALGDEEFRRPFTHPEWGLVPIDVALALYVWHGRHHTAHVRNALAGASRRAR
jgi:uncharacterized damage-inducible protein DinB